MTVNKFSTNIDGLGTNTIWHVGEYLGSQDRRILLLWTSSDIRNAVQELLPNWIDHAFMVLDCPESKLNCFQNALEDLRRTEIEILRNMLQLSSGKSFENVNESFESLSMFVSSPRRFREIVDVNKNPNQIQRNNLLYRIVNDPQTPSDQATEIYRHIIGNCNFNKKESLDFFKSALITFMSISSIATMCFFFMKASSLDKQLIQLSQDGGFDQGDLRYGNIGFSRTFLGDVCAAQSKKIHDSSTNNVTAGILGFYLSVFASTLPRVSPISDYLESPISDYIDATSSKKYPVKRKDWKFSRSLLAGSLISHYTFIRSQQKPATSLPSFLLRTFLDSIVLISAIAETKLLIN